MVKGWHYWKDEDIKILRNHYFDKFTNLSYGFLTRFGGYSKKNYSSLNVGWRSGDDLANVLMNRKKIKDVLGASILLPKIIHSDKFIVVSPLEPKKLWEESFLNAESPLTEADAIIMRYHPANKNIVIGVTSADCIPLLIYAADINTIAVIHSGWRGTFANISAKVIKQLKIMGSEGKNITVLAGPSIDQINYEVKEDFRKQFLIVHNNSESCFLSKDSKIFFDNKKMVSQQCEEMGVKFINCPINTYDDDNFYSYRKNNQTGRFLSYIRFKE